MTSVPTVAIAHDYLTQRGGAERVVLAMSRAFPGAPVHTSLYAPATTFPEFGALDVRVTALNRVSVLRRQHRLAFPVLAPAFARHRIDADVVLCSSSGWAHGVRTDARRVVYCHTPARWLYGPATLFGGRSGRVALSALRPALKRWDRRAAGRADRYFANSGLVADRIQRAYGIEAEILPPPLSIDPSGPLQPVEGLEAGFVLGVSRLLSYKNPVPVVEAFTMLPEQRLVLAGEGPELDAVRRAAGPNVTLLADVSDSQLRWLYSASVGLVSAAWEDYGLTPIEAAAFGRPSAVLRWGGFLESVVEGRTGVFFDRPTRELIAAAVREMIETDWDPNVIRAQAEGHGEDQFAQRLRQAVTGAARVPG